MVKLEFLQIKESREGFLTYIYAVHNEVSVVGEARLRAAGTRSVPERLGDLGFEIDEPYRRRGYATAAARALLDVAKTLGMVEISLCCKAENEASVKIAKKLGFRLQKEILNPERGKILKFTLIGK
ncbi:MAG: GNAT family N-acetyltransferase [Ruminococcaceae bacterium]|nr:GNAT family N-acetyltransferase [Oscillospiraceae bacterium]